MKKHHSRGEETRATLRVWALLGVVFIAYVLTITLALWQAVRTIDEVESFRNRLAISAAFRRELTRVEILARANNDWDDEVFEDDIGRNSQELLLGAPVRRVQWDGDFDEISVLDANRRLRLTIAHEDNSVALHGPSEKGIIDGLAAKTLTTGKPQTALLSHHGGLAVYATALLDNRSDIVAQLPGSAGGVLVVHENIDNRFMHETASLLQLRGLELRSGAHDSHNSLLLTSKDSPESMSVKWTGVDSAVDIVVSQLPIIAFLAIGFLLITYQLARRVFSSFRFFSRQARLDWLSGLPNRWALQHAIRIASRAGKTTTLALMDLDSFKTINDYHGHSTGDQVIRHIAQLLRKHVPGDAFIARIGGDEFAILRTGADGAAWMKSLLDRLILELAVPFHAGLHSVQIGASAGVATLTGETRGGELLRRADIAMYAAKRNGKMTVAHYDEAMDADASAEIALMDDLAVAIEKKQIALLYQPIVDASTAETVCVEALARWTSDQNGSVEPERFIAVAEKFGLISSLSDQLLELACRECLRLRDVRVAVNVSASQIDRPDFCDMVRTVLARTGFPPERLELEITETSLIRGGDRARAALQSLSAMGIRLTLDDFGTGFASIGFLRQFRFDALKIDRSIVSEATTSSAARGVVVACVAMARALDIEVVAEGVETEDEASLMRAAGCQLLQGWLFSPAVGLPTVRARLEAQQAL